MDEAKHTPGIWTCETDGKTWWVQTPAPFREVVATNLTEANARLIAAAPGLLIELEVRDGDLFMLRKAVEAGDPKAELLFRIGDMQRETRAAISKAQPA